MQFPPAVGLNILFQKPFVYLGALVFLSPNPAVGDKGTFSESLLRSTLVTDCKVTMNEHYLSLLFLSTPPLAFSNSKMILSCLGAEKAGNFLEKRIIFFFF